MIYRLGLKGLGTLMLASTIVPAAIGVNIRAYDNLRANLDYGCATSHYIGKPASKRNVALAHSEARSPKYMPETQSGYQTAWNNAVIPIIWGVNLASSILTLPGTEMAVQYHNQAFHTQVPHPRQNTNKKGTLFAHSKY